MRECETAIEEASAVRGEVRPIVSPREVVDRDDQARLRRGDRERDRMDGVDRTGDRVDVRPSETVPLFVEQTPGEWMVMHLHGRLPSLRRIPVGGGYPD